MWLILKDEKCFWRFNPEQLSGTNNKDQSDSGTAFSSAHVDIHFVGPSAATLCTHVVHGFLVSMNDVINCINHIPHVPSRIGETPSVGFCLQFFSVY